MKYQPPQPQSYSAETAALITQLKDRIQRLEEMYEGEIGENPDLLGSNVMGLLKRELNTAQKRIKRLEGQLMDTKNKHSVLVADVVLDEDRAEQIKRLIAERDTARTYADQKWKLREEFHDLFGTDDIEQGVAVVREMRIRIERLKKALDLIVPNCSWVHHSKKHQHKCGEPCPVVALIENAKENKL